MTNILQRLSKLEAFTRAACRACRGYPPAGLVVVDTDGTEDALAAPTPCPACGETFVIRIHQYRRRDEWEAAA